MEVSNPLYQNYCARTTRRNILSRLLSGFTTNILQPKLATGTK